MLLLVQYQVVSVLAKMRTAEMILFDYILEGHTSMM